MLRGALDIKNDSPRHQIGLFGDNLSKFVAVTDFFRFSEAKESIKHASLLFDYISPAGIEIAYWLWDNIASKKTKPLKEILDEFEWLKKNEIVIEPPSAFDSKSLLNYFLNKLMSDDPNASELRSKIIQAHRSEIGSKLTEHAQVGIIRRASIRLREKTGWDTVVLDPRLKEDSPLFQPGQDSVAQIILRNIPKPDPSTPWEVILEYRSDPDSRVRFFRLKNWINKLASSHRSPNEIEDELRELIHEYEEYMKLHRMKVQSSMLEAIVTIAAEIVEGLIKFKWSDAAKALFSIKRQRIELLEAEREAPGREIAYLIDVRKKFT